MIVRLASIRKIRRRAIRLSKAAMLFCAFQINHALGGEQQDKSGYNLFRPTPDALLREMATDRPDRTESAYTVDAGHYQIEMDLLTYTYDRSSAGRENLTVEDMGHCSDQYEVRSAQ